MYLHAEPQLTQVSWLLATALVVLPFTTSSSSPMELRGVKQATLRLQLSMVPEYVVSKSALLLQPQTESLLFIFNP